METLNHEINNVDGFQLLSANQGRRNLCTITDKTEDGIDFVNTVCLKNGRGIVVFNLKDTIFQLRADNWDRTNWIFKSKQEALAFKEKYRSCS